MICKKCSAEYNDEYAFCPECGESNEQKFSEVSLSADEYVAPVKEETEENDMPLYRNFDKVPSGSVEDRVEIHYEDISSNSATPVKKEQAPPAAPAVMVKKVRKVKGGKRPMSKAEKNNSALVIAILCLVGIASVLLTFLNVKTKTFESETQVQKAVPLTKLSAEEETQLEKEIALYFSLLVGGFDGKNADADDLLRKVNPADRGNFYSVVCGESAVPVTEKDPAMRFENEQEQYSYYKIEASKIDKLSERFNVKANNDANDKDFYYYDGFYYFNTTVALKHTPIVSADITKSKKVLDGSYYVECYFYISNGTQTVKTDMCYLVAEKNVSGATDGYFFKICKADAKPLFDDSGNPISQGVNVNYKIESKVIEGRTTNGTLFCKYVIEYPVFSGSDAGEVAANEFFKGMISSYELKASSAQKDCINFVSNGGSVQELPFVENVIATVAYADAEKISVTEKVSTFSPEIPEKQEETTEVEYQDDEYAQEEQPVENQQLEQEPVKLFSKKTECYIFDRNTGRFLLKDEILGKDYMLVSEILYRIYNSYEYESLLPQLNDAVTDVNDLFEKTTQADDYEQDEYYDYDKTEDADGIPDDEYGFGTIIYESPCGFTEEGFAFYYVEDEGYVTEVVIPWTVIDRLSV